MPGTETEESVEQPEKRPGTTRTEPSASVAERREEPSKGPPAHRWAPVDSSEAGIVTDSTAQPVKALEPSLLRPSGSVRLASDEQPEKAPSPTDSTVGGRETERREVQPLKALAPTLTTGRPPSSEGMARSVASPA